MRPSFNTIWQNGRFTGSLTQHLKKIAQLSRSTFNCERYLKALLNIIILSTDARLIRTKGLSEFLRQRVPHSGLISNSA